MIADDTILDADINASAAIADTKLATISTAGKVSGTAITSGNIDTSGSITTTASVLVLSAAPALKLEETDGTSTHNRNWIVRDGNSLLFQTRSSADDFVSNDYLIPADASGATSHVWRVAGSEEARLTSTGLGIGTNTPSHRLEVARLGSDQGITGVDANTAVLVTAGGAATGSGAAITIAGGTASSCSIFFGDTANGDIGGIIYNNTNNSLTFRANAVNQAEFDSTGRLLLGGVTPGTSANYSICTIGRLQSQGSYDNTTGNAANVFISTTGLFSRSTSSIKYKTDVEDAELSYSESLVFNSRPVWYRSLSESDPSEYSYWGFIAEEVAEIDPRMVHWGKDGPEGVQYERYVVHLVSVIQKQKQQLDAIESRLAALEAN
jgi:hypothetical protein